MKTFDCELTILVARPDVDFMVHTVSHLVSALRFPFRRRVLVVDTAPLSGKYSNRTNIPSLVALHSRCDELIRGRFMDEAIQIDYSEAFRRRAYSKHLGGDAPITMTHDSEGPPVLGYIFCLEQAQSRYLLHCDSDMMLHQNRGFNWVEEGIKLLRDYEDVMAVLPLSGPPSKDRCLHQGSIVYERDTRGFYRFKNFTSRCFLIDRERFQKLLPLKLLGSKRALINFIPPKVLYSLKASLGRNGLCMWEDMVSRRLESSPYVRADLDRSEAWTLHPPDHGAEFLACLPEILKKVESGFYPVQQAGHYDLRLEHWVPT